ncbi:MAG: hypothetical protein R3E96_05340 [Planctomycetota bacterium]
MIHTDGTERHTTTDRGGAWQREGGLSRLEPADGFAFVPIDLTLGDDSQAAFVQGQFRVRVLGDGGGPVFMGRNRAMSEWAELAAKEPAELVRAETGLTALVPGEWTLVPTSGNFLTLMACKGELEPGHPIFVGQVVVGDDGVAEYNYPTAPGTSYLSRPCKGRAGESIEFSVRPEEPASEIRFAVGRGGISDGLVVLHEKGGIGGSTEGGFFRRRLEERKVRGEVGELVFGNLQAGVYSISSALHVGDRLLVSNSEVEVHGGIYLLAEGQGMGAGAIEIQCEPENWRLETILSRGEKPAQNIAVELPLAGIKQVIGLDNSKVKLAFTRGGDIKTTELLDLDLSKESTLRKIVD